jgi:hypothetical protein
MVSFGAIDATFTSFIAWRSLLGVHRPLLYFPISPSIRVFYPTAKDRPVLCRKVFPIISLKGRWVLSI